MGYEGARTKTRRNRHGNYLQGHRTTARQAPGRNLPGICDSV
ncbi:hypothetical protein L21_1401 [Methanoculleus chikugoensis]|uniref:Uncharacterized protein n=1 Tax=Methanoculleus chikugoensis TaxID=118126 RepID=A0A1M4ML00_9EURY|nr:hypothetical protein [Methanoculleus chikugoensis]SCL75500.1 hypothetical protein L21_1401 [Methanoculleus chikugoensis]